MVPFCRCTSSLLSVRNLCHFLSDSLLKHLEQSSQVTAASGNSAACPSRNLSSALLHKALQLFLYNMCYSFIISLIFINTRSCLIISFHLSPWTTLWTRLLQPSKNLLRDSVIMLVYTYVKYVQAILNFSFQSFDQYILHFLTSAKVILSLYYCLFVIPIKLLLHI